MSVSFGVLTDERFLRAHDAELVSFGVGKDRPGLGAGLSDVYRARPERKKAVDLLIAIGGAGGEVNMHAILDRLGIGDRHEAHADRRVLVDPDDDLILALAKYLPAKRLRPEPGQARQIMSINDDVVQSYGHVASMRRLSEGVAAAVEAETAAFLDGQDMAGAVGRRAAQVLREPWSAEADRDAVALKRPVVVAAFIRVRPCDRIKEQLETPPGPVDVGDQVPGWATLSRAQAGLGPYQQGK